MEDSLGLLRSSLETARCVAFPAAGLVEVARKSGARVAVLNPDPTPADELAEWVLRGPAGQILPRLL